MNWIETIILVIMLFLVIATAVRAPKESVTYAKELSITGVKIFNWGVKQVNNINKTKVSINETSG